MAVLVVEVEEEVVIVIMLSFPAHWPFKNYFLVVCERFLSLFPSLFMAILYHGRYPILITPLKDFRLFQKVFSGDDGQMLVRCSQMFLGVES